jgi:hypothetical protein
MNAPSDSKNLRGFGEPVRASAGRGSRVFPPFSLSQPREYTRVLELSSKRTPTRPPAGKDDILKVASYEDRINVHGSNIA